MSLGIGADRITALMEQEGCAGCAEKYAIAAGLHDDETCRRVIAQAIEHISDEGYDDGQARAAVAALQAALSS